MSADAALSERWGEAARTRLRQGARRSPPQVRAVVEHVRRSSRLTVGFGEGEDGMQSMPLGATPVWPWGLSKKPTPLTVARPLIRLNLTAEGRPHALIRAPRACLIFSRACGEAR